MRKIEENEIQSEEITETAETYETAEIAETDEMAETIETAEKAEMTEIAETEVAEKKKKKNKKSKAGSVILSILLIICLGVIGYSGYQIFDILSERAEGEVFNEEMNEYITVDEKEVQEIDLKTFTEKAPNIYVNFARLMEVNDDICGWIIFPNTKINYPVVKGMDNSYYLTHTSNKKSNACGAIFVDMYNLNDFSEPKTIIYGHRMNNGSMFENLLKYREQEFYNDNPYGILLTPDEKYVLQVFAAREVPDDLKFYSVNFSFDEDFEKEIETLKEGTLINCPVTVTRSDRIVMLSTCVRWDHSKRFIVLAKLVTFDEYNMAS